MDEFRRWVAQVKQRGVFADELEYLCLGRDRDRPLCGWTRLIDLHEDGSLMRRLAPCGPPRWRGGPFAGGQPRVRPPRPWCFRCVAIRQH